MRIHFPVLHGGLSRHRRGFSSCTRLLTLAAFAGLLTGGVRHAPAATYTWLGSGTGGNNPDSSWNNSFNWANGARPVSAADTQLVFGAPGFSGTNGTSNQDLADPFTLFKLSFTGDAPAYTISGKALRVGLGGINTSSTKTQTINNAVTLTANQNWVWDANGGLLAFGGGVNNNGYTLTLSSFGASNALTAAISGAGGLVKMGSGTLTLTGVNVYTGSTTFGEGTLAISASQALGTGGLRFAGGTLLAKADVQITNSLDNAGNPGSAMIFAAAPGATLNFASQQITLDPRLSTTFQFGTAGQTGTVIFAPKDLLIKSVFGTPKLVGNLVAGTLQSYGDRLAFTNLNTNAGSIFDLANQAPQTLSLSGSGTVLTSVAGTNNTLKVSGGDFDGSLTGAVSLQMVSPYNSASVSNGLLVLTGNNTNTGTTTIDAGTLQVGTGETSGNLGSGNVINNSALIFNRLDDITVANTISGTGTLTQTGTGTLTLTGNNAYTGVTNVSVGTLMVGSGGTAGTLGSGTITNNSALVFNRSDAATVANAISGTGSLTKIGVGTLTLKGTNTYTGGTAINGGTILALFPSNLAGYDSTGKVVINAGGTIAVNISSVYINNVAQGWTSTDISTLLDHATFNPGSALGVDTSNSSSETYPLRSLGGSLGLTKLGRGTLGILYSSTYTGGTLISAGTLALESVSSGLGTGPVVNNATLLLNYHSSTPLANDISGTGQVTKQGDGTWTLTGNNTYSGGTTISGGRLVELNTGAALGVGTVAIRNGALLELSNTALGTEMRQAGGITFTGAGTLQKTGAGTVFFGGNGGNVNVALSAAGLIDVQAGTLAGSSYNQGFFTDNKSSLNIAAGATFDGVEGVVRVDGLYGAGTLKGGYFTGLTLLGSTTIGVANGSGVFSGSIQDHDATGGKLSLIKAGTGTQTLAGVNSYTGATSINGGTLKIDNNPETSNPAINPTAGRLGGTSGITVNTGGTLLLSGSVQVTDRLNDAATVTLNGGGTLATGGMSEGTRPTAAGGSGGVVGVGALTLANTSAASLAVIDFGNETGSTLVFSNLTPSSKGAYVNVLGFTGTVGDNGAATNDRLLFVGNPGFTTADLARWQFRNDAGTAFATGGAIIAYNGYYEIVPVPEPATWAGGALLLALTGWTRRRRTAARRMGGELGRGLR